MPVNPQDLHALEVALRDSRNMDVIRALARLSNMPTTADQLQAVIRDLGIVRTYIEERVPESLKAIATQVFTEHAEEIQRVYRVSIQKDAKETGT